MLRETLQFLLDVLVQPFAALLLLRFHLQWMRAPMRNPLGEFVMALTNFAVLKLRRVVPAFGLLDMATLVMAFLVELAYLGVSLWAVGFEFAYFPLPGLLLLTALKLVRLSVYLLIGALFVGALLSWVNPHSPIAPLLNSVTSPFLRPLRKRLPAPGHIDLSPLVMLILCQLLLMLPLAWLERVVFGLV